MRKKSGRSIWLRVGVMGCLLGGSLLSEAQNGGPNAPSASDTMAAAVRELQEEVRALRSAVTEMRLEAGEYRTETEQLRRELQATRAGAQPAVPAAGEDRGPAPLPATVEQRIAALEESSQLLNSKVDDQYQTKIEAASKYRVRLSGLVLLNVFGNRGNVDSQEVPTWAIPQFGNTSGRALGMSLRQSELGLEVFGPNLAGARTSGNLQVDFSGGFADTLDGVNFGLVRLRIASIRMDWKNTSIVAGQDSAFVTPLSPTSFASLAIPALGYAGNLWGWVPQVRVERRFDLSEQQNILLQGGILDNVTGELPGTAFERPVQAGENSGQPAYAARVAWTRSVFGMPLTVGAAGYYSPQKWTPNTQVDGWAGMTDWSVPLMHRFNLSGEFFRGRAIGGLGGGIGRSVLFTSDPNPYSGLRPLSSVGGWMQLKFRASSKLEFNGTYGLDSAFADDVRGATLSPSYFGALLLQNRSGLLNFVYRPRSDLLFSGEYRRLRTFDVDAGTPTAQQVNMMMGILF